MKKDVSIEANLEEVASAITELCDKEEVLAFLKEICSSAECKDIATRWMLMKMLANKVPQRKIAGDLHMSLCKITRGSKYMRDENSILRKKILEVMGEVKE